MLVKPLDRDRLTALVSAADQRREGHAIVGLGIEAVNQRLVEFRTLSAEAMRLTEDTPERRHFVRMHEGGWSSCLYLMNGDLPFLEVTHADGTPHYINALMAALDPESNGRSEVDFSPFHPGRPLNVLWVRLAAHT